MGDAEIFRGLLRVLWARVVRFFAVEYDRCDRCLETFDHSLPGFFAHRKICCPDALLLESAAELDEEFPEMPSLLASSGPRNPPRIEGVPVPPPLPPPDRELFGLPPAPPPTRAPGRGIEASQ